MNQESSTSQGGVGGEALRALVELVACRDYKETGLGMSLVGWARREPVAWEAARAAIAAQASPVVPPPSYLDGETIRIEGDCRVVWDAYAQRECRTYPATLRALEQIAKIQIERGMDADEAVERGIAAVGYARSALAHRAPDASDTGEAAATHIPFDPEGMAADVRRMGNPAGLISRPSSTGEPASCPDCGFVLDPKVNPSFYAAGLPPVASSTGDLDTAAPAALPKGER